MPTAKANADLLLRHGRIITMDPERRILVDGAVAVRDGRIVAIGPDRDVASSIDASQVRELNGAVVHPGLVDAHIHTSIDLIRGLVPESTSDWTDVEVPYVAGRTAEDDYLSTLLCCMELVANGATIYSDTGSSKDLDATARATETVGIRGMPGNSISDIPGEIEGMNKSTDECLALLTNQIERYPYHNGGRVRCAVSLTGMGTGSDTLLTEAKALTDAHQVPMIMHESWDKEEVAMYLGKTGRRPIEHLADLGILGPNLTLIHMIQLKESDVKLVVESGTNIVHCPSASIRRAMGAIRIGRFPEMLKAGVNIGLGSDGHSGKHDVPRQMYLAATLHREVKGEIPTITAQTAFEMATLNGARALGLQDEIGSLEVGKRADIVIHGLDRPECRPRFKDPVVNLVYHALARTVDTVIVEGENIFDRGKFTRFDVEEAYAQLDAKAAALEAAIGIREADDWPLIS